MNDAQDRDRRRERRPEAHLEPSRAWILGIALEDDGSVAVAPADIAAGLTSGAGRERAERTERGTSGGRRRNR